MQSTDNDHTKLAKYTTYRVRILSRKIRITLFSLQFVFCHSNGITDFKEKKAKATFDYLQVIIIVISARHYATEMD